MLSKKDNELLTQVGPGTPMGELMRRYWHPIAGVGELDASPFRTKEVRVLGEDLVLFRDRSGRLGLIQRACPHRRVNLAYGVIEEDGIRCQYHGWKFDHTGRCLEQPFEDTVRPEGSFKDKTPAAAYPVEELAGLVFAYMGPRPAPLLPRWEPLVWDEVVRDIAVTELPCNWLQCQENSLDPVHAEWLHTYYSQYLKEMVGRPISRRGGGGGIQFHRKIGFDTFDYGIIKRRIMEGYTEESDDWKIGHPILFPHILLVGNQFSATMQFRVPMDDTHTFHVSLYTFRAAPGTKAPVQETIPVRYTALQDEEGKWVLDYTFNQDFSAWVTQGPVAERDKEKLGESDKGIILFRQLLKKQMQVMQDGGDPLNVFRDPALAGYIELPLERIKSGNTKRPPKYIPGEAGFSADAALIEEAQKTWDLVGAG